MIPLTPIAVLLAAALANSAGAQGRPTSAWREGEPLPRLRLPTIDGGTFALSELRGRPLLLVEFASW